MTLKMKLTALISAFMLVLGLMIIGIMAVDRAQVNMGGSINFNATDVYARVTGNIKDAQAPYTDYDLPTLEFSAENGNPDQSGWSGLDLEFDTVATDIVITITVENLAVDRTLTANLVDNTATAENLEKEVKNGENPYTSGSNVTLDASTGEGTSTTTFTITFGVESRNNSVALTDFDFDINLYDESYDIPEYEILEGFTFDENGTLTSYSGNATDLVIPSTYSIIKGEPVDKTLEFSSYNDFANFIDFNPPYYTMSLINLTFKVDNISYGPYPNFDSAYNDNILWDAIEFITKPIILSYQESGDLYVVGQDYDVTSIGLAAFNNNKDLTNITIPNCILNMGDTAFYRCDNIKTVNYLGTMSEWCAIQFGNSTANPLNYADTLIIDGEEVPAEFVLLEEITSITGTYTFAGYKFTSITLPSNLTSIGDGVFSSCRNLTSITLPSSITSIGNQAFQNCTSLTSVTINKYVYENVTSSSSSCGYILAYIGSNETVYVPKSIFTDDPTLTNAYLENPNYFTKSENDDYYIYTRV